MIETKECQSIKSAPAPRVSTYRAWLCMRVRCLNKNRNGYQNYGGRGITFCKRWDVFENFLADMGERPAGLSLDRIDNDGNYEPGNCRWATHSQQMNNTRLTRRVTYLGETHSVHEWARITGISRDALHLRIDRGWPLDQALTMPVDQFPKRRREGLGPRYSTPRKRAIITCASCGKSVERCPSELKSSKKQFCGVACAGMARRVTHWSKCFAGCVICGTSSEPHIAHGKCRFCHNKWVRDAKPYG